MSAYNAAVPASANAAIISVTPLAITASTLTNALGQGMAAVRDALRAGRSGLRRNDYAPVALQTWIGRVEDVEAVRLPAPLSHFDCRNHRLALLALEQDGFLEAIARASRGYGADRVGLFLGTSTSGIEETEYAYGHRGGQDQPLPAGYRYAHTHNLDALAAFVQALLGLSGVRQVISTACSSSAKVFGAAQRHLAAGLCDAAVVGGVDSLCRTTLFGFNSLQLVSAEVCRPWDSERDGISIGEGAGFALLEARTDSDLEFVGYGDSCDAYHMSSPHPQGAGAAAAMRQALDRAGLPATAVDYLNLHGTATRANDAAEDQSVLEVLGADVAVSSTKGSTGHTLGAAGITEALICCMALREGFAPGAVTTRVVDRELRARLLTAPTALPLRVAMSNSLGFGGSNASLVFRRVR